MTLLSATAPVCLVYPALPEYGYKIQVQDRESLALGYLIAALETQGVEVNAINAELLEISNEEVVARITACPGTILVGISAGSEKAFPHVERMAAALKAEMPQVHVTLGGIFATTAYEDILRDTRHIDSVTLGEGERVIFALYEALATGAPLDTVAGIRFVRDGVIIGSDSPRISDLDALPFPARRDLEFMLSAGGPGVRKAKIATSRGCYARCSFCSIHEIFGNRLVYRRSPENIIAEIRDVIDNFGIHRFTFMDDLFITPSVRGREWVTTFCTKLIESNLNVTFWIETRADTLDAEIVDLLIAAGMDSIFIGIEAGSPGVLDKMQKDVSADENTAALNLLRQTALRPENVRFGYIMFVPDMTFNELVEQYEWIKGSGYCRVQTLQNRMNIYRGTPEYRRLKERNTLQESGLGILATYAFEDEKVGEFETRFRAFHAHAVKVVFAGLHDAQRQYIRFIQTEKARGEHHNLMSQMLRRLENLEREQYYRFFDAGLHGRHETLSTSSAIPQQAIDELNDDVIIFKAMMEWTQTGGAWQRRELGAGEIALAFDCYEAAFLPGYEGRDILDSSVRLLKRTSQTEERHSASQR